MFPKYNVIVVGAGHAEEGRAHVLYGHWIKVEQDPFVGGGNAVGTPVAQHFPPTSVHGSLDLELIDPPSLPVRPDADG